MRTRWSPPVTGRRRADPVARSWRPGAVTYMWAFLACGLWYWGVQLVLATVVLVLLALGEARPAENGLLLVAEGWPPFAASSLPFWLTTPVLMVLTVETVKAPAKYGFPLEPGFVALYLVLAGSFAASFSMIFPGSPAWPRDSIWPALALLVAAAVVATTSIVRWGRRTVARRAAVSATTECFARPTSADDRG